MPSAVYIGTSDGIVHRSLDFAGRSLSFATYRDTGRRNRITLAVTIGSGPTVKGCTTDEVFRALVQALDAVEPLPAVARITLRHEVTMALHGEPLPPEPEPFTTLTNEGGRLGFAAITAGTDP